MRYTITLYGPCRKYGMFTATVGGEPTDAPADRRRLGLRVAVLHRRCIRRLVRAAIETVARHADVTEMRVVDATRSGPWQDSETLEAWIDDVARRDFVSPPIATVPLMRWIGEWANVVSAQTLGAELGARMNADRPCARCGHGQPFHDRARESPELRARLRLPEGACGHTPCDCTMYVTGPGDGATP